MFGNKPGCSCAQLQLRDVIVTIDLSVQGHFVHVCLFLSLLVQFL